MTYSVYEADPAKDELEILRFWKENHPKSLDKKYERIYAGNPAGKARVWMLKHKESARFIGITALFPRKFLTKSKSRLAGITGDFLIQSQHRTAGPAILMQKSLIAAAEDGGVDFVYGFPNQTAEPIMKRAGYRVLGSEARFVKILKSSPQLKRKGLPNFLISLLGPLCDFILKFTSIEMWYRSSGHFICKEVNDFDERFENLWERGKSRFVMIGDRSRQYLNWKFIKDPDDVNKVFAIFDPKEKNARGYIVHRCQEESIEIRDLFFAGDDNVILVLMTCFLRHVRSLGFNSVTVGFLENEEMSRAMRRLGFWKGKSDQRIYWYCPESIGKEEAFLNDPNNWLLMLSDQDT